jgi:BirA family biotin operon repressor/biotin-[acetyl-CoA-carboxylase] ligase
MSADAAFLDADLVRQNSFARYVEVHDTLGSTNDRAMDLARQSDLPLPFLIAARVQTAGRGRESRPWWSADGALAFSLVLDTDFLGITPSQRAQLSLTTGVAVCDAIRAEIPQAIIGLKWPNDVLVDGGKACGILIESPGAPAGRLVVGIGVNVNNSWHSAPREAGPDGVALCDVSGSVHDLQNLLIAILAALQSRYQEFTQSPIEMAKTWQEYCLLTGEMISVRTPQSQIDGECLGIAEDGALLLATALEVESIRSGTVTLMG